MPPLPTFTYDPTAGRYRRENGQFVTPAAVRAVLDEVTAGLRAEVRGLAARYAAGELNLTAWEFAMRAAVKDAHLMAAAAGAGGWARLTSADYGRVGQIVRDQYAYLNRFAAELSLGLSVEGAAFAVRTEMYIKLARRTFYDAAGAAMEEAGFTHERNVLGDAEHCADCIYATRLGRVPIGTLRRPGDRKCLSHCECHLEFT